MDRWQWGCEAEPESEEKDESDHVGVFTEIPNSPGRQQRPLWGALWHGADTFSRIGGHM